MSSPLELNDTSTQADEEQLHLAYINQMLLPSPSLSTSLTSTRDNGLCAFPYVAPSCEKTIAQYTTNYQFYQWFYRIMSLILIISIIYKVWILVNRRVPPPTATHTLNGQIYLYIIYI